MKLEGHKKIVYKEDEQRPPAIIRGTVDMREDEFITVTNEYGTIYINKRNVITIKNS